MLKMKDHLFFFEKIFSFFQGKWNVPLPKVKAVGEDEVFKVIKTGKTRSKASWPHIFPPCSVILLSIEI